MDTYKRVHQRMRVRVHDNGPYGATYCRRNGRQNMNRLEVHVNEPAGSASFCGTGARHLYAACLDTEHVLRQPLPRSASYKREGMVTWKGLDQRVAVVILCLLTLIMLIITGSSWSGNRGANREIAGVNRDIRMAEEQNRQLTLKRAEAEREVNVSYQAARQGMVSSKNISSITLTLAPAGRNYRDAMNNAAPETNETADTAALAMLAR